MASNTIDLSEVKTGVELAMKLFEKINGITISHDLRNNFDNYTNKLVNRRGYLPMLGKEDPLYLEDIYVKINIKKNINAHLKLTLDDMNVWEKSFSRPHKSYSKDCKNSLQVIIPICVL